jgi:hypothetical protein
MADIYKRFAAEDIIPGDVQTVSSTVWSGNVNPLTTFFTSSNSSSWEYYVPVYNANPTTNDSAEIQFSVAFGNRFGSGSLGDSTVVDNSYATPSRAVYSQFRNLLLPPTDNVFTLYNASNVAENADSIYVVTVNRARFKSKLDPGNWELRLGTKRFIDGSGAGDDPNINEAGRVFKIYSGSGGVTSSAKQYGLFYPDLGVLLFSASALTEAGGTTNVSSNAFATNSIAFVRSMSASAYLAARTEEKVTSNHYFVRVTNQQFNFSNNPTFTTGSYGQFRWSAMLRNPQVYITTIGLYDDYNRLLAVAKLSRPLLKSFNREALIKVKIDY